MVEGVEDRCVLREFLGLVWRWGWMAWVLSFRHELDFLSFGGET